MRNQNQTASGPDYNLVLEDDLRDICGDMSVAQRCKAARKFQRWAEQLVESAKQMDPKLAVPQPSRKVPRGFFLVNLAKWRQDDLRKLARECGVPLRNVIEWALRQTQMELQEKLKVAQLTGVKPYLCWRFIEGNASN